MNFLNAEASPLLSSTEAVSSPSIQPEQNVTSSFGPSNQQKSIARYFLNAEASSLLSCTEL